LGHLDGHPAFRPLSSPVSEDPAWPLSSSNATCVFSAGGLPGWSIRESKHCSLVLTRIGRSLIVPDKGTNLSREWHFRWWHLVMESWKQEHIHILTQTTRLGIGQSTYESSYVLQPQSPRFRLILRWKKPGAVCLMCGCACCLCDAAQDATLGRGSSARCGMVR
jgi:hypothetical protein